MYRNLLALLVAAGLTPAASAAVTRDNFVVRNTQDLVALCSVTKDDPLYEQAIHFCHGYGVGSYHYYAATRGPTNKPFVCPPNPTPSRSESLQDFLKWVQANPKYNEAPAVESVFRFLAEKFPCPKQ